MASFPPTQESTTAHYLHASLECFDRAAAQEILRRFEGAAAAIDAEPGRRSLKYVEQDHVFYLICQNHVGAALDERLGQIIRDYVASEHAAVTRFAECDLADPFDDYHVQLDESEPLPLAPATHTIHLVNFDGINSLSKAKAFRLGDLDLSLKTRAESRNNISSLMNAITFRRARWDELHEHHEADVRFGHELQNLSQAEYDDLAMLIALLAFSKFTATIAIPRPHSPEPGLRLRRPGDQEQTIDQWLERTDETRQIDPDAVPEMTRDARKFAAGSSLQPNLLGRIRQPVGASIPELIKPEMDVEPATSAAQMNETYAALMNFGAGGDSDAESSDTTADEASIFGNIGPANMLRLAGEESTVNPVSTRMSSRELPMTVDHADAPRPPASLEHSRISGVQGGAPPTGSEYLDHEQNFPKYDKSYASVDGVGLRGDAANQVDWEIQNPTMLQSLQKGSRVRTYEAVASSRAASVSMSSSAGQGSNVKQIISKTPMSRAETAFGGDEPWANKVVAPVISVPTGILVDTEGSVQDGRPKAPKFPPGLFPPLVPSTHQTSLVHKDEPLIQLDENEAPVIERKQPRSESNPRLYRTMRQQASKKKSQQKHKPSSNRPTPSRAAQLELPSPPPPPKVRREVEPAAPQAKSSSRTAAKNADSRHSEQSDRFEEAITGLSASSYPGGEKADVVIQFGLALLISADDLTADKAMRCADLQSQLDRLTTQRRCTLFPVALGRTRKDAYYLLRLPTMPSGSDSPYLGDTQLQDAWTGTGKYSIDSSLLYEIVIVVPGGHEWMLVFDQERLHDVEITPVERDQQSVYVHYPARVWDARIRPKQAAISLKQLDKNLKRNIITFLKTFNTPKEHRNPELPNFEAMVPDAAFSVTSVLAKRVWTRALRSGTWTVSQVWDLHVQTGHDGVLVCAEQEGIMAKTRGRLWWEASLQYDGRREELEATMNEIVEKLDFVGTEAAPEKKPKSSKRSEPKIEPYNPYW